MNDERICFKLCSCNCCVDRCIKLNGHQGIHKCPKHCRDDETRD